MQDIDEKYREEERQRAQKRFFRQIKTIESLQAEIAELKAGREGMVLVPKAPTETMLLAGANCQRSLDVIASKKLRANNIYLHMLKAHNGGEG